MYKNNLIMIYSDEYVDGEIEIKNNSVNIFDWNSKRIVHGGTEIALMRIREQYNCQIFAIDAGYIHEPSFKYWMKMLEKNLIDGIFDDNGIYHNVRLNRQVKGTFNEWLVEKKYISEISQIIYELSSFEVDELYQMYENEY